MMKNGSSYLKRDDIMSLEPEEARDRVVVLQSQVVKLKKERTKLRRLLHEKKITIKNLWRLAGKHLDDSTTGPSRSPKL